MSTNENNSTKGSVTNPYTEEEMNTMMDEGKWTGGYVKGIGYVGDDFTAWGSSGSDTSDSEENDSSWSEPWDSYENPWENYDYSSNNDDESNNNQTSNQAPNNVGIVVQGQTSVSTSSKLNTEQIIAHIYSKNSSLTDIQKSALIKAIGEMNTNSYYAKIFHLIAEKGVKIKFYIDPEYNEKACYVRASRSIKFSIEDNISSQILREEFIHAAQHIFYEDSFSSKYKNYELEAQIIADMLYNLDNNQKTIQSTEKYLYTTDENVKMAYKNLATNNSKNITTDFHTVCNDYYYITVGDNPVLESDPNFIPKVYLWITSN